MGIFRGNRNLLIIALIAVVNALGYGIIIPVVYSYSERFGIDAFQYGFLFALFSLCQFLSTPIIGRLSDKYGRRPLLIISLAGTALSFFMMAFAPNALILFLARALDGITAGNIPVASAVISDTTDEKDRAKGFGIIGAAFGFGFIFGPLISALTVEISPSLPFIIAGCITILATVLTTLFLPETNKHMGEVQKGKLFNFGKLYHSLFEPNIGATLLITLAYYTAFGLFITVFQLFSNENLGLSGQQISLLYMMYGTVGLVTQIFLLTRFTKQFGLKNTFRFAFLATSLAYVGMYLTGSIIPFILVSILLGVSNSLVQPLTQTILSMEVDAKSQGSIQGVNASYMSIGQIIGPILGGYFAKIATPLPFLIGSGFVLLCFALSFRVLRPGMKKEEVF